MDIIRGKQSRPPRIVVYGVEGIGKSSFGASAPNPIILQTEDGLDHIEADRLPLCTSYKQFMAQLGEIASEPHDYETLVVDTLDWLEKLIWAEVCEKENKKSIEEIGYAKGYKYALNQWKEVISGLDWIRNNRGMIIILLAHAKIERFEDP